MLCKEIQRFVKANYDFAAKTLRTIDMRGELGSVHAAFCWKYEGQSRLDLVGKHVVAVAFDQGKQEWDFPGGRNDCSAGPDRVVQFLRTLYKELYEELSVCIRVPLKQFVLGVLPCGRNRRSLLVVCGVRGLVADRFVAVMQEKQGLRLPAAYREMVDFRYLGLGDACTLACATSFVREQHARVIAIAERSGRTFPAFNSVMELGFRGVL